MTASRTQTRDRMLGAVRAALGRKELSEAAKAPLHRRLAEPQRNVVPARGRLPHAACIDLFVAEVDRISATTLRLPDLNAVPEAVVAYLRQANLPAVVRAGTDALLQAVPWSREPLLQVGYGAAQADDAVSVTAAFAGIAETGTLMLLSDVRSPTTLNFLPETHIVVLPVDRVVGVYEDAWERLRSELGNGTMPRVVNWITGQSRTADIEQTLLLGAHGPKQLHILLVDTVGGQ